MNGPLIKIDTIRWLPKKNGRQVRPALYRSLLYKRQHSKGILVKPVLSGHLKIDKIKVLMESGSLMKVESIAECSPWSILQYF